MRLVRITLILLLSAVLSLPMFARGGRCNRSGQSSKPPSQTRHPPKRPQAVGSQNDRYSPQAKTLAMRGALKHEQQMMQSQDLSLQSKANVQRTRTVLNITHMQADSDTVEAHNKELASLQTALSQMKDESTTTVKGGEGEYAAKSAKLEGEIEELNSVKNADDIAVMAEENGFRDPRGALLDEETALRQQRHPVDVGGQVCDLFAARNLRIVDVYDRDGRGNVQRAFGRIFYAEGKSLIFYAYDLADPRNVDQQISFYAWGERLGGGQPVKRLGIFHSEDISEGRWALTFNDPGVLAQINSVFVTVEEGKKAITRPNSKKILSAFLGNKANNP